MSAKSCILCVDEGCHLCGRAKPLTTDEDLLRARADECIVLAEHSEGTIVILTESSSDCVVRLPDGKSRQVFAGCTRVKKGDVGRLLAEDGKLYFMRAV